MHQKMDDEIEINLNELLFVLLRKFWIAILAGMIGAIGCYLYSNYVLDPVYTSSTKIYVINRQNEYTTTITDLQTGTQLTKDYKILVLSRTVTEQVIRELNLNMSHNELVSNISVDSPEDTRILEIKVKNTDPMLAKQLADAIAKVSAEQMVSVMEMEKVNVVEPGDLPTAPSSPNVRKNTMMGGAAGVLLSALIIIFLYMSNDSIRSSEDVEKHLGLTTLGALPMEMKHHYKKPKLKMSKRKKKKLLKKGLLQDEGTLEATSIEQSTLDFTSNEAYKTLRTNIQFCGKDIKTICITSSLPNEGKTVISFRLAKTIAESGKKVLFIDADLRKSVIVSRLKIEKAACGLSQYLSGMNKLEEIINKTNVPNVDIIFTGAIPPNPSELLDSDMFKKLIKEQRKVYDYVIVDTPPLGIVIDSANVAEVCDGTIMVVEANSISNKLVQKVLSQLQKGKCRVLGVVINKMDVSKKGYYGKYYGKRYGKRYGKYYGKYELEG